MADKSPMDVGDRSGFRTGARHCRRTRLDAWLARRRRDDRGTSLVEAAFVMPVFVLLLFGVIEFSGYVAARSGANAAVKAGARMATVAGADPMAEREIINRMAVEGSGLVAASDVVEEVKIWKAEGPNDDPPATCNAGSDCNHYSEPNQPGGAFHLAALSLSTDPGEPGPLTTGHADCYFGYDWGLDTADCPDAARFDSGWPTKDRRVMTRSPGNVDCPRFPTPADDEECQSTDYVGIWIKVRHDYWTGFIGDSVTVESKTVAKIEPQEYDK